MTRRTVVALVAIACVLPTAVHSQQLPWQRGPGTKRIGDKADISLTEDYVFLDQSGTKQFLTLNQNPVSGNELAVVAPISDDANWFLVFEWDGIGYVRDDEADSLDPNAILSTIRQGTEASNEEREARGWPSMHVLGWHEKPNYDPLTHNLTWAIIGESEGHRSINRNTRLLGRHGVMSAVLVSDPAELAAATADVDNLLGAFQYKSGSSYAEFLPGKDKVAEYGLVALVAGGAGAALVKSGLLAKLWKPLVVGAAALLAGLQRLLFRRKKSSEPIV
jgi:uncharacterized membrane-anchored protein